MTDPLATFCARILQDALDDATASYWRNRAATFEAARPRPGDYHGRATRDQIAALDRRLCATRDACHARADAALLDNRPEERVA